MDKAEHRVEFNEMIGGMVIDNKKGEHILWVKDKYFSPGDPDVSYWFFRVWPERADSAQERLKLESALEGWKQLCQAAGWPVFDMREIEQSGKTEGVIWVTDAASGQKYPMNLKRHYVI